MQKIRVLVVDDHAVVRDGICALLALVGDMEVVGQAGNGMEAIRLVEDLRPDVVLMDIAMPVMDGLEATRRICRGYPRTRVMILSQYDDKEMVFPVIQAGASGFITKVAASSELVSGIRTLYRGDSFLAPSAARLLVSDYQHGLPAMTSPDPYGELTDRERDVLKLVADGHTTKEIASVLSISPKTVEGHKTNLMAKLGLHRRIDLVKYAMRRGIVTS